jgi:hypothetical protein
LGTMALLPVYLRIIKAKLIWLSLVYQELSLFMPSISLDCHSAVWLWHNSLSPDMVPKTPTLLCLPHGFTIWEVCHGEGLPLLHKG